MTGWAEKYSIVSEVRCLGLLMGISFGHPDTEIDPIWVARTVRDELLKKGVWAICNEESTLRMYPALNMNQEVFLLALDRVEEAIDTVNKGGKLVGDYPGMPTGVEGF